MPADPHIFDEEWAEEQGENVEVKEVSDVHAAINTTLADYRMGSLSSGDAKQCFVDNDVGLWRVGQQLDDPPEYEALLSIGTCHFSNPEHEFHDRSDIIRLAIGQNIEDPYFEMEEFELEGETFEPPTIESFSQSYTWLEPGEAVDVARMLVEKAKESDEDLTEELAALRAVMEESDG